MGTVALISDGDGRYDVKSMQMLYKWQKTCCARRRRLSIWRQPNPAVLIIQDKNIEEKDGLYIRNIEKSYNVSRFCLCCFVINVYIFIAKTRGFRVPSTVVCSFCLVTHARRGGFVARRDKNCCEWDYRDRRVWHAWKKKQKKKTKKQRKERKTSGQLHARKVVCAVSSRNASYMIGRGQMLPPPFRRGPCWPLGIPIKISFPFPIFHQSATTQRGQHGGGERDR